MNRISTLAILSAILLCSGSIKAQEFKPELAVGGSFGTTLSAVSFVPKLYTQQKIGYTGGITVRWNSEKNLGLQAEVNFAQEGWKELFEEAPHYHYARTINYIEIPVLTHIYFGSKRCKFFINIGPQIGFVQGENTDENLAGATPNRVNKQHDMAVEQRFGWGLCGGPGFELRTGIGYFLIEGRYYYGLGDIFNSHKEDFFSKSSSQVISIKATYLIPFRK